MATLDGEAIHNCLAALRSVGTNGGLGHRRVWWLLDRSVKKVNIDYPDVLTIFDQLGVDQIQMTAAFGSRWANKFARSINMDSGFTCWGFYKVKFMTVSGNKSMDAIEAPQHGRKVNKKPQKRGKYANNSMNSFWKIH